MSRQPLAAPQAASAASVSDRAARHTAIRQLYNTLDSYADRMALRMAGPIALVCSSLAWVLNWGRNPIPFAGDARSFGVLIFFFSIIIAFGVAATGFVMGVRYRNGLVEPELRRAWGLAVAPLALAYAAVTMILVAVVLQFIDVAFKELALEPFYAALVVGMMCGAVAYYVANRTLQITVRAVLNVFVIILFAGVATSAINIDDPRWWQESFSFLGTAQSNERSVFNATLIMAGILFVILQQFFMDDFIELRRRGMLSARTARWIRISLIALGVLMAMVGLVPFGSGGLLDTIHSVAAYSLAGILLTYMLLVRRLLPHCSAEFYAMTWFMVVVMVGAVVLHLLGSINVVGVELICFAVGGTWFLLFVKNVELLVSQLDEGERMLQAEAAPR